MSEYDDYDFGGSTADFGSNTTGSKRFLDVFDVKKLAKDTGIERLSIEADKEYTIDILPFPITERHPYHREAIRRNPDKDPMFYVLSLFLHKVKTEAGEQKFVCPKKTWGKTCPFCDEKSRLFDDGGFNAHPEEIKALNDSRRDYFLVRNHEDDKVYLFYYPYSWFLENIEKKQQRSSGADKRIILPYPGPNGWSIKFFGEAGKLTNRKTGKKLPGEIKDIEFLPRKEAVPDKILESLPSIDGYIIEYDYSTIETFLDGTYWAGGEDAYGEEDIAPKKESVPEIPMDKEAPHIPSVGKPVEDDEDAELERLIAERKRLREEKLKAKDDTPKCPVEGGTYGQDAYTFEECDDCELLKGCVKAMRS